MIEAPPTLSELPALATKWLSLQELRAKSSAVNSTVARRSDLVRVAYAIHAHLAGASSIEARPQRGFDFDRDLGTLTLTDLTTDNLVAALLLLRAAYAPKTTARTMGTTRGFCRWLHKKEYLPSDPADDDYLIARQGGGSGYEMKPYRALDPAQIDMLRVAAADPSPAARSAWPSRDLAIIEVLAGCGPRATELCSLQLRHFATDLEQPLLRIVIGSKGSTRRDVPLPRRAVEAVERYLPERAQVASGEPHAPLFVRNGRRDAGRELNRHVLGNLIQRIAKAGGVKIPDQAVAHAFRHQFGEQLAIRGVPLTTIMQLLGHADPSTTAIYTVASQQHLVDAMHDAGML